MESEKIHMHLYHEWHERAKADGIFDDAGDDDSKWAVDEENAQEFIEALSLTEYIDENKIKSMIGGKSLPFSEIVKKLADFLINEKKLKFQELMSYDNMFPADRISKFLKMLRNDIEK